MTETLSAADLRDWLRDGRPIIDVRAPTEFAQGSVTAAVNLPILDDEQRHQVGIRFKSAGQAAAIELGETLVSAELKTARVHAWTQYSARFPLAPAVMCWRGGLRSGYAVEWLREAGVSAPRIEGGFKRLRHLCLAELDAFADRDDWLVIGGRTGSGKTSVLGALDGAIDLEGYANHRGSAFGGLPEGQPTPIAFENALAIAALRHTADRIVVEDEGRLIGRLGVPRAWHERMQRAPIALVEVPREARVAHIFAEYVGDRVTERDLAVHYLAALDRIRKRLGGDRHRIVGEMITDAFATGDAEGHRRWIERLLEWYYDPMYDYQLDRKRERIVARGSRQEIIDFVTRSSPAIEIAR
ncbi:MAG: tRNA 2-selenouridine(34) synthase MnmH [Pseudomonadota bacterium]